MAWSDEPTENQLRAIYSWFSWEMDRELAVKAVSWLQKTATRSEVSTEMSRLKKLKEKHLLDLVKCFESEIWEGFEPAKEQE